MARFLSDAWFEALEAAWPEPGTSAGDPEDEPLVLQHVVTAGPAGDVCYHVRLRAGRAQVVRGPAARPDVTFAEDYATASAIASGELSAPSALLSGRIRVAGDMARLISRQGELAVEDPVPSAVRAATSY